MLMHDVSVRHDCWLTVTGLLAWRMVGRIGVRVLSNCMMTAKSLCSGQKKAREMWFLARLYDAQQALEMGLVNTVVPLERLEEETLVWCGIGHGPMRVELHPANLSGRT